MLAFEALRAVDERDAYANLVLPPLLRKAREKGDFDGRDAALATELVYGTLRRQGTYDAVIAACVDRPLREVDPPVLDVLSLGAHQLLGTRIPTHAAVSASVELARVVLGDGRAKFVNAVLRKVAPAGPRRLAGAGGAALRRGPRGPSRRRALASPLGRLRAVGLPRRRPGRHRGPAGGRQRAARGHPGRPAGPVHRARNCSVRWMRTRRCRDAGRRTPCGSPRAASPVRRRRPGGPGRGAGRGQPARRARRSPTPRWTGRDRALAGRLRRTGRQGRAARGARRRARGDPARLREAAAPGAAWSPGRSPGTPARTR